MGNTVQPVAQRLTYRSLYVQYHVLMAIERITNYTEARQNLKSLMDSVIKDRAPVTISERRATRSSCWPRWMLYLT